MTNDWLFKTQDKIFGFRSSGVLLIDGKILLQRSVNDTGYALPGGHVAWGETGAEAVVREYKEEIGVDVTVHRLLWVEENFWQWGDKKSHHICHHYLISADDSQIPTNGSFKPLTTDESSLIFRWIDISEINTYEVYPQFLKEKINNLSDNIEHFVRRDI